MTKSRWAIVAVAILFPMVFWAMIWGPIWIWWVQANYPMSRPALVRLETIISFREDWSVYQVAPTMAVGLLVLVAGTILLVRAARQTTSGNTGQRLFLWTGVVLNIVVAAYVVATLISSAKWIFEVHEANYVRYVSSQSDESSGPVQNGAS